MLIFNIVFSNILTCRTQNEEQTKSKVTNRHIFHFDLLVAVSGPPVCFVLCEISYLTHSHTTQKVMQIESTSLQGIINTFE